MKPKTKAALGGVILISTLGIMILLQHNSILRRDEQNQLLANRLAESEAEIERLSNLLSAVEHSARTADNKSRELLRLRSEVGQLRQRTNATAVTESSRLNELRDENARLRFQRRYGVPPDEANQAVKDPPQVAPENIYPREALRFAGFATPEASPSSTATWSTA